MKQPPQNHPCTSSAMGEAERKSALGCKSVPPPALCRDDLCSLWEAPWLCWNWHLQSLLMVRVSLLCSWDKFSSHHHSGQIYVLVIPCSISLSVGLAGPPCLD